MSKRFTLVTVVLSSLVAFLVGLMLTGELTPAPAPSSAAAAPVSVNRVPTAGVPGTVTVVNFADVAERMNAAVVNIDASANVTSPRARAPRAETDDSADALRETDLPRPGSGSGFIIDPDGFILTNNHLIEAGQRITVTLTDGRTFRGEVVGADAALDVALIRLRGASGLPTAPLGDSDELRVGEWVGAIGNPLGYVHSLTVGVVSFVGRKLFDPSLDDYIQTDAAINFGNSGGPLINVRGEVIGINAAVSSRTSSIGFAIPINQAVAILPQLKSAGRVSRGFIGVTLTDVTPALRRALALSVSRGAVVQDVSEDSPAQRAGLRPYDVIVDVEGRAVSSDQELIRDIAARPPGSVARLKVLRDGRALGLAVKLAERPRRGDEFGGRAPLPQRPSPALQGPAPTPLGISVRNLERGGIGNLDVPSLIHGVVVRSVDQTGPAYALLRRGLVIMEINRTPTPTVAAYEAVMAAARPGDVMAVYYYNPARGERMLVALTVE